MDFIAAEGIENVESPWNEQHGGGERISVGEGRRNRAKTKTQVGVLRDEGPSEKCRDGAWFVRLRLRGPGADSTRLGAYFYLAATGDEDPS